MSLKVTRYTFELPVTKIEIFILPVAYLQNFADSKSSLPFGILQKNTRETTFNLLKI